MCPTACLTGISLKGDDGTVGCRVELRTRNGVEQYRLPEQHEVHWQDDRQSIDAHTDPARRNLAQEIETLLAGKNRHGMFFVVPHRLMVTDGGGRGQGRKSHCRDAGDTT